MASTLARDDTGLTTRSSWSRPSFFGRSLSRRNHPETTAKTNQPKCSLGLTTLYTPETPAAADLVFVHGLNGDAQNTWSRDGDSSFWPREWLPKDEAFREVRIHTFGYSSAIFTDGGVLEIPDFARSMLAAIQDAPSIPPEDAPPLVLVGHSMGGLVIKKAYILGHEIPEFQPLVNRIKAFFFLATPHQGADIALTLSRVLSVVNGKRQPSFVNDLFPQSPVVQSINDDFPRLCDSEESLQLFSFFETRPMNYGVGRGLIVDKHSAVMNYPRERRTHLDANHRDVARYTSPDDPSYITVRNALAALLTESILDELNTDISLLLQRNVDVLPASTGEGQERLADRIRRKSKGSFLWATLILKELRQVYTAAETELVLASYPSGMDGLYHKIVDEMAQARYGKDLAKAILVWTTCAFRPLSCEELQASIQLDIKEVINDAEKAAMSRCGNLVFVDNRGRIQLIHTSARDFLLKDDLQSEFSIDIAEGHRRLALASIQCLTDNAKIVKLLAKFLASPSILNWIEHIAAKSDLQKVYKAGITIIQLLKRQPNSNSDIGHLQNDMSRLDIWGSDLLHLSFRFSSQLRQHPSAIHRLISPFCPLDSMIRKQFCVPNRGLGVHGATATWNDCFTVIALEKGLMPTSITVGNGVFALGFQTGKVVVYDDTIFQEVQTLEHQEAVRLLKFGETGKQIASASDKSIRIWNMTTWTEVYRLPLKAPPLVVFFIEEDSLLLVATTQNEIMLFDLSSGELHQEPVNWTAEFDEPEWQELRQRAPAFAAFSPHHHLLAITYRGDDILVWDTAEDRIHGFYSTLPRSDANLPRNLTPRTVSVKSLTLCSAPDTCLLAATYDDGSFVVYNVLTRTIQMQIEGANIFALASSPDGSTLAVRTRGSVIWLDSGNLRCLHREPVADDLIASKLLSVTADGQDIIEFFTMQCRIWRRPDFACQGAKDVGDCKDVLAIGVEQLNNVHFGVPGITALCCVNPPGSTPSIIITGKHDGTVHVYEISGELSGTELFTHGAVTIPIDDLHFDSLTGLLTCRDRYGRITCRKLTRFGRSEWAVGEILAAIPNTDRWGHHQVLGSGTHSRVLSSCRRYASLWPFGYCKGGPHLARIVHQSPEIPKASRWCSNTSNSDCLILSDESGVELRSWTDLSCINKILFPHLDPVFSSVNQIISFVNTRYFATAHIDPSKSSFVSRQYRFHIWDFTHLSLSQETFQPTLSLNALSASVQKIIGIHNDRLIYLDLGNWVCSITTEPNDEPVRHFFIPNDWLTSSGGLVLDIAKNGEIVFVRQLELAVIKRGLDMTATGEPLKSSGSLATLPIRSELTG
ncbi:hypothetical protein GE09DRAFT_975274 [Coniochaeta sp. 2T2.1]|nr:hypothetical protein GE09DRAFT_975274 [Coniochaeta sp. 2T2.1]